ncbi:hypothetical protein J3A66_001563 [Sphingomonas sp. PvP018]|nr:hypothetical protein [Sphingomonas sp. PvP018]
MRRTPLPWVLTFVRMTGGGGVTLPPPSRQTISNRPAAPMPPAVHIETTT